MLSHVCVYVYVRETRYIVIISSIYYSSVYTEQSADTYYIYIHTVLYTVYACTCVCIIQPIAVYRRWCVLCAIVYYCHGNKGCV